MAGDKGRSVGELVFEFAFAMEVSGLRQLVEVGFRCGCRWILRQHCGRGLVIPAIGEVVDAGIDCEVHFDFVVFECTLWVLEFPLFVKASVVWCSVPVLFRLQGAGCVVPEVG